MTTNANRGRKLVTGGFAALALLAFTGLASAGECPANKMKEGATAPVDHKAKGVTDTVISSIDLAGQGEAFKDRAFRMRKLVVQPGGIVPWHDHAARPANIYILSGSITEYRGGCEVPIVHKAGEVVPEFGTDHAHWWKNNTKKPAVLLSADILTSEHMEDHTM